MEKENAVAIAASKDVRGSEEATVIAGPGVNASVEQALGVQYPIMQVSAGASEAAGGGKLSASWDPYEVVPYVAPNNLYDTNHIDALPEVENADVGSDDEDFHTKTRQVLRRLKSGPYENYFYFVRHYFRCPFCQRNLIGKDFNSVVMHDEPTSSSRPKVGESTNVYAFMANHKALGIHLRDLQQVAIMEGRMQAPKPRTPKIKGLGSKKWWRRQRE